MRFHYHIMLQVAIAVIAVSTPSLARDLPSGMLAIPVLISTDTGVLGTGFYMATSNRLFLVTARHILFGRSGTNLISTTARLLSYPDDTARPNAEDQLRHQP